MGPPASAHPRFCELHPASTFDSSDSKKLGSRQNILNRKTIRNPARSGRTRTASQSRLRVLNPHVLIILCFLYQRCSLSLYITRCYLLADSLQQTASRAARWQGSAAASRQQNISTGAAGTPACRVRTGAQPWPRPCWRALLSELLN